MMKLLNEQTMDILPKNGRVWVRFEPKIDILGEPSGDSIIEKSVKSIRRAIARMEYTFHGWSYSVE